MELDLCIALLYTGGAVVSDLYSRRIPNLLTFPAALLGLTVHGIMQGRALDSVLGGVCAFLILLIPFLLSGVGAGDVKLLAAVGLTLGVAPALMVSFWMAVSGALIALLLLTNACGARAWLGVPWQLQRAKAKLPAGTAQKLVTVPCGVTVPYGVAIFLGVAGALFTRGLGV